jgi:ectoine hydroxylase-related dioxygenase (phytanoyl-CoA dioxygenase family)
MAPLGQEFARLTAELDAVVKSLMGSKYYVNNGVRLHSVARPNALVQHAHRDYIAGHCERMAREMPEGNFPMGVVMAVDPGTKFILWPGTHRCLPKNWKPQLADSVCLRLHPGHVLFFHGMLVHAGARYRTHANDRIHYYVDHSDYHRPDNQYGNLSQAKMGVFRGCDQHAPQDPPEIL